MHHWANKIYPLQAAQIQPTSVIKTEYSTFTYFITSLDGSQTVTSTDIVISSNVVTETVAPTPTLPDGGLASSDYVNTFAQCGNYRDFSVSQILREIKLGAFRDVLKKSAIL